MAVMAGLSRERQRDGWVSYAALLLVLALALKVTIGLHGTFDVYFDDETIYLDGARHLGERSLPLAESSPLYPMWYRLLGVFEPDPLKLYFLNWFVLTASLPVVLFALARRSGAPVFSAMAIAIVWALSSASMTWPFVSKLATLILALGALAASCARDKRIAIAIGSATLSATAYARPELVLPSAAFAGIVVFWCIGSSIRRAPDRLGGVAGAALAIAPPLLLHGAFRKLGSPFGHNREFFAFGQHYALNVVESKGLSIDPWTSWLPLAREAFPKAETIAQAARENPSAFLWHVKRNVALVPEAVRELLRPLAHQPSVIDKVIAGLLLVTLAWTVATVLKRRSVKVPPTLARWLPMLLTVGVAAGGSAILVHPRQHYILPLTFLMLAAIAGVGGKPADGAEITIKPRARHLRFVVLGAALLLLIAVPTARSGALPSLLRPVGPPPLPESAQENRATIHALRKLGLVALPWGPIAPRPNWMPTVVIFEPDYSRGVYAFYNFVRIEQWRKEIPFWAFVHKTWTNVIIINWRMKADAHLKDDPEFLAFVDGTGEREDFEMIPVEGTTVVIAVRRAWRQFTPEGPKP